MAVELTLGLIFLIVGIVLLLAEAHAPGFFLGVPATVLVIISILSIFVPGFFSEPWSPITVVVVGAVAFYISMRFYARLAPPQPPSATVATSLIGRLGVVTHEVTPDSLAGKVMIDHQVWSATAAAAIPVGIKVQVVSSEGVHVVVQKTPEDLQVPGPPTARKESG